MALKIHGTPPSPFARKVLVVLEEKGVPHEVVSTMPFPKTPELLALHPLGKIPILEDGDLALPDSSAICAYIERKHPSPALYPSDSAEFARALWLEEYSDTRLAQGVGGVFFQRFVKPHIFKQESDEAVVQQALTEILPEVFDYLEGQLGDREFLAGDAFSIADAAVCSQIANLKHGGESLDAGRWPKLARYFEAITGRPAFKAMLARDGLA